MHCRVVEYDIDSEAIAQLRRIIDNADGHMQDVHYNEVTTSDQHGNLFVHHPSRLMKWLGLSNTKPANQADDQEQPLLRNVEDNIQRPVVGANYDDSTPWRQHDNALIRQPVLFLRWLWFKVFQNTLLGLLAIIGSMPLWYAYTLERLYLGVVRLLCLPLVHPVPVFLVAFVVVSVFLGLYVARGDFPTLLLLADGFIIITLGVLGKYDGTREASTWD